MAHWLLAARATLRPTRRLAVPGVCSGRQRIRPNASRIRPVVRSRCHGLQHVYSLSVLFNAGFLTL